MKREWEIPFTKENFEILIEAVHRQEGFIKRVAEKLVDGECGQHGPGCNLNNVEECWGWDFWGDEEIRERWDQMVLRAREFLKERV